MMVAIVFIPIAALLFLLGALIRYKKTTWLIAGYNTASKQKKEQYDIDKLCRYTGNLVFTLAAIWSVLAVLLLVFGESGAVISGGILVFMGAAAGGVVFMNTGRRLKKEADRFENDKI